MNTDLKTKLFEPLEGVLISIVFNSLLVTDIGGSVRFFGEAEKSDWSDNWLDRNRLVQIHFFSSNLFQKP